MEQLRDGAIVQVYHPRYRGRIGKVVGRNGNKILVTIDRKTVSVDADKVLLVREGGGSNEHRGTTAGTGAKIA